MLPFYEYNVKICNFLQNFAAHLKPCGGRLVTGYSKTVKRFSRNVCKKICFIYRH